jgi:sugar/nucleoside kinase (ribokinase family)
MAAGHVCLDIFPQFPDTGATAIQELMQPGKLIQMGPAALGTGGAVSNTGIAMKRLGNSVCFSARVGDDAFGGITMAMLEKNGSSAGIHVVPGGASSYTVVVAPPRIDRIFLHNPGTNDEYGADDLDPALVSQCRLFHFGYPVLMRRMYQNEGRELLQLFKTAKEAGATTSCDLAMPDPVSEAGMAPWSKILTEVLPYVDIFLPSIEEALLVLDREEFLRMKREHGGVELFDVLRPEDYSHMADRLLAMGTKMVSLKSGYRGFYLKTGSRDALSKMGQAAPADIDNWADRELWCPSYTVSNIASATGAGDCSIAGFLTTLLRGGAIEDSLRIANCLGWQNVQTFDATSGIRTWEETQTLLAGGMPMNEFTLDTPGWTWTPSLGLWSGPNDPLSQM